MKTERSPSRRRVCTALTLLIILLWPEVGRSSLKKYFEARTANFRVVTNDGERTARQIAEEFEAFRAVLQKAFRSTRLDTGAPVPILGARNQKMVKEVVGDRGNQIAGVLRRGIVGADIVLRADLLDATAYYPVYHEYIHLLLRFSHPHLPPWLDEGLAEVWENIEIRKDLVAVGRPKTASLQELRARPLIPLETFLEADHASRYYRDSHWARLFYAQAWALTHYLMLGEGATELKRPLAPYLALTQSGVAPLEAAERLFGDLSRLEKELRAYVRRRSFPYVKMMIAADAAPKVEVRRLTPAQAASSLGEFYLNGGRLQRADELFAEALASEPGLAGAHQGLAVVHALRAESQPAAERFSRALELDPDLWLSHYGYVVAGLWTDAESRLSPAAEHHLVRATQLNPGFAPAFCRLAEFYRLSDPTPTRALAALRRAIGLEPGSQGYRLEEARFLSLSGDRDAAQAAVKKALAQADGEAHDSNTLCWRGSLAGLAEEVMPACEVAATLHPESPAVLDSRGLARALTGDTHGAIEDFRFALAADQEWSESFIESRSAWLEQLEKGQNPFDGETLEQLRQEDLGWGY